MSAPKWTPGPWRIGDAGGTIFGPPSGQPAPAIIAYRLPRSPTVTLSERKANLILQAAGPEMAEALMECVEGFRDTFERDGGEAYQKAYKACEKARALLARLEAI